MIELRVHRAAPMTLDKGQVVSFTQHPDYYMHGGAKSTIHLLDGRTIHLDTPYADLVRMLNAPKEAAAPPSQETDAASIVHLWHGTTPLTFPWQAIRHVTGPAPNERFGACVWLHNHQEAFVVDESVAQVLSAIEMAKHASLRGRVASTLDQRAEAHRYHNVGGDDEIVIDEDAQVSIAPDAFWIQAWLRVPKE